MKNTTRPAKSFSTAEELLESAEQLEARYATRLGSIDIYILNLYRSAVQAARSGVRDKTPVDELRTLLIEILKKDGGLAKTVSGIFHVPGTPLQTHRV